MPLIVISALIISFLVLTKALFFWLWLWQLKEYHCRRFKAHFETQPVQKLLSSFWRIKFPKLTKKTLFIILYSLVLEFILLVYSLLLPVYLFYGGLLILIILSPAIFSLVVFVFQGPTIFFQELLLKRARRKREKFKDLIVVAITGSYGKTSCKEFLYTILSEKFGSGRVLKTERHINAEVGIAKTILRKLKPEHQIFVAEVGAYERGKIAQVCRMLQPRIGILTGINEQHLSTFGSQENIIQAKFELIENLPLNGVAIFNGDNLFIKSKVKSQKSNLQVKSQKFCSVLEKANLWAEDIQTEKESISFRVFSKDGERVDFAVNLLGGQNVENILLAAACAKELGMSLEEIAAACRKIRPEQGSAQFKKGINGLNIIDATYSANPDGVRADLDYLKLWSGQKILVMPCLIELGKAAKDVHQRIGERVGQVCDLAIITTQDYFQDLKEAAVQAGMPKENILLLEKPRQILEKIKNFCQKDDIILLESRVPSKLVRRLLR
jgi:UDP-N-acetylmuramoyl-tripeptide--D-alanyl-D-alanine ligase